MQLKYCTVVAVLLSACASPEPPVTAPAASPSAAVPVIAAVISPKPAPTLPAEPADAAPVVPAVPAAATPRMSFNDYLAQIRRVSCPAAVHKQTPEPLSIRIASVPLQALNPRRKMLDDLVFVGGFHMTSPDQRFGGLSGLDVLDDGNLLAISDAGDFVWIDLGDDKATPVASRIASMRDAEGGILRAKSQGDAEGLALNDGLALVSFERDHRVLAFDLAACGAAARGAPITFDRYGGPLPQAFASLGVEVDDNSGVEALGITRDGFLLQGLETRIGQTSPLSVRPVEASSDFDIRIGHGLPEVVGLDVLASRKGDVRAFSLHRARNPLSSSVIAMAETRLERVPGQTDAPGRQPGEIDERSHERFEAGATRKLADMNLLFTIDNFEGMAAREMQDGSVRLYLISDNNFSAGQRTLLLVFDLPKN